MVGTFNKQGMLSNILRKILSDFPEPTFIAIIRKSNESRAKEYISQVLCQVGFLKEDTPENSDLSFCLNRNYNLHPTNFIRPNK